MNADLGYIGSFEEHFHYRYGFPILMKKRKRTGQGQRKTSIERRNWRKNREKITTPKRWIVERTFAWMNGYRRLSRDYEKATTTSETMIYLAMTQLLLRRLDAKPP